MTSVISGRCVPPTKRIVQHDNIARFKRALLNRGRDRHRHRTQMHRHVIAHRNHLARSIENRTGVVAALLDIRGEGSPAQGRSHFFSDGVIEVLKDLNFDRITRSHNIS